jgi:hypothetical protein
MSIVCKWPSPSARRRCCIWKQPHRPGCSRKRNGEFSQPFVAVHAPFGDGGARHATATHGKCDGQRTTKRLALTAWAGGCRERWQEGGSFCIRSLGTSLCVLTCMPSRALVACATGEAEESPFPFLRDLLAVEPACTDDYGKFRTFRCRDCLATPITFDRSGPSASAFEKSVLFWSTSCWKPRTVR